jgi:hypothetical protein
MRQPKAKVHKKAARRLSRGASAKALVREAQQLAELKRGKVAVA